MLVVPVFLGVAWVETGAFLPALGWAALALSFLAVPLVGWARVHWRRHSWTQAIVGGVVGAAVTLAVLSLALR